MFLVSNIPIKALVMKRVAAEPRFVRRYKPECGPGAVAGVLKTLTAT